MDEISVKNEMDEYLDKLTGCFVRDITRDICETAFRIGDYILHIQCAWRITNADSDKIRMGVFDVLAPCEPGDEQKEFDYTKPNTTMLDKKIENYLADNKKLRVEQCDYNGFGDLIIHFSNKDILCVYIDVSDNGQCWKLYRADCKEPYLALAGDGYYIVEPEE